MPAVTALSDRPLPQGMPVMFHRLVIISLAMACLLVAACGNRTTHLPATDEVGWVEFIVPSRTAPTFTIIARQRALARVALDAKPSERNDDRALLGELTPEVDRPLIPSDPHAVREPSIGCSSRDAILVATRSGHVVIITPQSITRDGVAVDAVARRWFLDDDGTLIPLVK